MTSVGTDSSALLSLRRLDPDAWEHLYREAYPLMRGYAARRTAPGTDPDDLVSEAMARAMDRIGAYEDRGTRVQAWLFGVLRNVVLEHVRATGRSEPLDLSDRPSVSPGPLEAVLHHERADALRQGFDRLSEDDREVLWFRVVVGMSAAETAEIMGRREGAVRQAQSRALARLRTQVEEVDR